MIAAALLRVATHILIDDAKQIEVNGRREHFTQKRKSSKVASLLTFGKDHKVVDLLRNETIHPVLYPDSFSQKERHVS